MAHYEFQIASGTVVYETDEDGLIAASGQGARRVAWNEVVAAGEFAPRSAAASSAQTSDLPSGLHRSEDLPDEVRRHTDRYWIASRSGRSRRLLYLTVPRSGDDADEFVRELRERIGDRWRAEAVRDPLLLRREFGVSNWWIWPVTLVLMLVIGLLMVGFFAAQKTLMALLGRYMLPVMVIVILCGVVWWGYLQFYRGRQ